ncbi:hypothetical protein [Sulfurovum sp.]|uniref:hypothetical protein n=1 Tax=Sulfurovum sp. TaxID=1969726 RepID=UPI0025D811B4|nr:hypothetical protein [Sulfurovum sp.]
MKAFLFLFLLLGGMNISSYADVTMHKRPIIPPRPVHPIEPVRPVDRPIVRPYVDTAFVDNRVINNTYESCDKYKDLIDELNAYIDSLEQQIAAFKEREFARMRKKLKEKNDKELKAFDERKSSIKTKNSITITDKPEK